MTIRFFILQTHYRSTLDFSNEALQASEKGLKRMWEAHEFLKKMADPGIGAQGTGTDLDLVSRISKLLSQLDEFMNDDFNTAKVLANMFELVPVINSIKDGIIKGPAIGGELLQLMRKQFSTYLETIFGLRAETDKEEGKLTGVMELLIEIRKDAKTKKDYVTSDKIRNQLLQLGIVLKDEKDGGISYSFS
jgi:cysteinyl-tRNA synthetase